MALVTSTPIQAVVAYIMQAEQGEYGPYQSVLFESPALEGGKLWRAMHPGEAQQLSKGQAVELAPTRTRQGKDSWNIRLLESPPAPLSQPTPQPQHPAPPSQLSDPPVQQRQPSEPPASQSVAERRSQIEAYVFSMANLHAVCYQAAEQAYAGQDAPDEVIRAGTSSLFIAAERRFRLASPGG